MTRIKQKLPTGSCRNSIAVLALLLATSVLLSPTSLAAQGSKVLSPQSDSTRLAKLPKSGAFKPFLNEALEEPPLIPNLTIGLQGDSSNSSNHVVRSVTSNSSEDGMTKPTLPQPGQRQRTRDPRSLIQYPLTDSSSAIPANGDFPTGGTRGTPLRQPYQAHLRNDQLQAPAIPQQKQQGAVAQQGAFQLETFGSFNQEEAQQKSVLSNQPNAFNAPHSTRPPQLPQPERTSPPTATSEIRSDQVTPRNNFDEGTFQPPVNNVDPYTGDIDLVRPASPVNQLGNHVERRPSSKPGQPQIPNPKQFWEQFPKFDPQEPKTRTAGYDSMTAVLNNGFWFAGIDTLYFEPMFQDNNAFIRTSGTVATAEKVDFGFNNSFRGYFGFETNAGPAVKLTFTRINEFSNLNEFTFSATDRAVTQIDLGTSDSNFLFAASAAPGSRLSLRQQIKTNISDFAFYKDQKNPVSRVRGNVGLRHVSLQQQLFAGLDDPVNGSSQARNFNDYFAVGPRFGIEYFRPIGHTDLELQSGFFGSLLFGRRDQTFVAVGDTPLSFRQIGKVEPMSIFDLYLGVQWNIKVSKCQRVYLRTAIESQLWAGSDTALDIGSDLGLYGMTFGFGITR